MNYHGQQALLHWRRHLPTSYSRVEDPEKFFTDLGEQADAEIEDRYLECGGPDIPGETAEDKQARLTQAMSRAAEEVYAELVTPSPELHLLAAGPALHGQPAAVRVPHDTGLDLSISPVTQARRSRSSGQKSPAFQSL